MTQNHPTKLAGPGDDLGFPNVIVIQDLNLASPQVQIQVLEVSLLSLRLEMCLFW